MTPYPTTYINKVTQNSFKTIGVIGNIINNRMMGGMSYDKHGKELRTMFLLCLSLSSWQQNADGSTTGYTNILTEDQMNTIISCLNRIASTYNITIPSSNAFYAEEVDNYFNTWHINRGYNE